jgi:hypothetical protein
MSSDARVVGRGARLGRPWGVLRACFGRAWAPSCPWAVFGAWGGACCGYCRDSYCGGAWGVRGACLGRGVGMFSAPVIIAVIQTWRCRKFMFLCCVPAQVWMRPTSPWGVASWACPAQLPMYVTTAPLALTHFHKNETTSSLESLGCCTHGKGRGAHVSPTCFPTRPLPPPHREHCTSLSPRLRCCLPLPCCRVVSSTSCAQWRGRLCSCPLPRVQWGPLWVRWVP